MNEHEIMRVSDILALQSVKATYCEVVDECVRNGSKSAERSSEIFTEDVQADYGMGSLNGRSAVVEFLRAISSSEGRHSRVTSPTSMGKSPPGRRSPASVCRW